MKKIYLLLDSPLLQSILKRQLASLGCAIETLQSSRIMQTHLTDAVLILVDVLLPEQNGFRLLRQLRNLAPGIPLILLSGTGRTSDLHWARGIGASAVLTYPLSVEVLHRVLNTRESGV